MIHYISYFLDLNEISDRKLEVAPQSKIKYIINSIKRAGFEVSVVSTSMTFDKKSYSKSKNVIIDNKEKHLYLAALGSSNFFERKIKVIFMRLQLLLYLIREVGENDVVIFYHALDYISTIKMVRKFKKIKLIIELNDLYSLHFTKKKKISNIEKKEKNILSIVDAYILASPYMTDLIKIEKPYIISYGSYEAKSNKLVKETDIINVIYSGVIEDLRNAATLVAKTALYLPKDFKIHVAGYGTEKNIENFICLVNSINNEKGYEAVKFHGLLLGNDFEELLNLCSIGLNAHSYTEENIWKSNFSFPSKIPLNMSYNLYIVSYNMDIIVNSPFSEFTEFFSEFSPLAIASAIMKCNVKIADTKSKRLPSIIVSELDEKFIEEMYRMLTKIS